MRPRERYKARMSTKPNVDLQNPCEHVTASTIRRIERLQKGCPACIAMGGRWVHLRVCLSYGNVGCCDSSPNKDATAHFRETTHPIMTSAEPSETWAWCFVDEAELGP